MQFPDRLVTMTFCDFLLTLRRPADVIYFRRTVFLCFFGLPKLTNVLCIVKHTKCKQKRKSCVSDFMSTTI